MSYQAFITKIALRPHPNADRLQLATVLGEQVVVGMGMTDNEWVVYFPENGKLSPDYCQENDLFPRYNEAGERINAGYIDPDNRRVRAQNFRGEKSYGLVMPLSSLTYTAVALTDLMLAADKAERNGAYYGFTDVNGQPVCEKYIRYTRGQGTPGKPGKKQDAELGGMFPLYPDTDNLYHQKPESLPQLTAVVTEKLHGTSVPLIQKIDFTGLALVEWAKLISEGESTLAYHPREGVCVRFDAPTGVKVFKAKSHNFLIMEGVATEQEVSLEDLA